MQDDFGNALNIVRDLSIDAMNANLRFDLDGCIEGISGDFPVWPKGTCDEDCLKFFGMV